MKSIASINEQILSDPEKAVDFFITFCKAKRKRKKLVEKEIPFGVDVNSLKVLSLKPTEKELQRTDVIIKALYQLGKHLAIRLPSYRQFKKDAIVMVLVEEILLVKISRRVLAKTENSLMHIGIILTNEIFNQMGTDMISEAFAKQMLLIYLKTINESIDHFNKEIIKLDPFEVSAKFFNRLYYYKEKGLLKPFDVHTSPDRFANYYLQHGEDVLHCKTMEREAMLEVTIYQSATIENQKLIVNKNTIEDTLYIPESEAESFFAGLNRVRTNEAEIEIADDESGISIAFYIDAFHRYKTTNVSEFTGHCTAHFYRMIRGGFPMLTEGQAEMIATFICIQLGAIEFKNVHS